MISTSEYPVDERCVLLAADLPLFREYVAQKIHRRHHILIGEFVLALYGVRHIAEVKGIHMVMSHHGWSWARATYPEHVRDDVSPDGTIQKIVLTTETGTISLYRSWYYVGTLTLFDLSSVVRIRDWDVPVTHLYHMVHYMKRMSGGKYRPDWVTLERKFPALVANR